MPFATVVVKKVYVKELDYEDDYENTHSVSILGIDEETGEETWYSVGNTKQSKFGQFKIKDGLITENAVIEFKYTENGNYKNVKAGAIEILEEGDPPQKPKSKGRGKTGGNSGARSGGGTKGGGKSGGSDYEAGVTIGAALNNAALLAAHGVIEFNDIEQTTIDLANIAIDLKAKLKAKLDGKAPAKGKGKGRSTRKSDDDEPKGRGRGRSSSRRSTQRPEPEPDPVTDDDDFDDDIPFN